MRHVPVLGPAVAGLLFSHLAFGAAPASQDVNIPAKPGTYTFTWTGTAPAGAIANVGDNTGTGACSTDLTNLTNDVETFNVSVPAGFYKSYTVTALYQIAWQQTGSLPNNPVFGTDALPDLAMSVVDPSGNSTSSDGSVPHEQVTTPNPVAGAWSALACSAIATSDTAYSGTLTVTVVPAVTASAAAASVDPNYGHADSVRPSVPRYQNFVPPFGSDAVSTNGEYSIGFNPKTGSIMNMSLSFSENPNARAAGAFFSAAIFKVVAPELRTPMLPESCDADWIDVSDAFRNTPQAVADPILWTDQDTRRTFAADNTTGPNPGAEWAYSDDDGNTWIPAGTGLVGEDHETVVSGPYPPGSPYEQIATAAGYSYTGSDGKVHGKAVYWCAQDTVPDTCSRSDDGGITWTQPQIASDGSTCSYLHGHLHVAPDGTAYLPIKTCGSGEQGGTYTVDAGDHWTQFTVPKTSKPTHGSDPSIGIDRDGTLYYCYVNGDGHPHVQVGHKAADGTLSWGIDTDLGKTHGLVVSAFPEAVGGDSGRAACGFLGTNGVNPENPSDVQGVNTYESLSFSGVWYLYVATTYDAGQHWVTVNATPDDPVQGKGGIWQNGGSNTNRNLLDFNEITLDDKGRVLFGYNDGCVGTCVKDHVGPVDSAHQVAVMTVARQTGGRSLYARFDNDPTTDYADSPIRAPGQACLSGTRDDAAAHLSWKPGDAHGAPVTKYTIAATRADTNQTSYFTSTSTTADVPTDKAAHSYTFTVSAANASGSSAPSLPVSLVSLGPPPAAQSACSGLGLTMVTSPPGVNGDGGLPTKQDDLLAVFFGEPSAQPNKLIITMKVDNLNPAPPPGYRWITYFKLPSSTDLYWVAMSTADGPTPVFNYGTKGATTVSLPALGDTSVSTYTTLGTIDGSYTADGLIQLVLDTSSGPFALKAGDVLTNIAASIRHSSPSETSNAGLTVDSAPGNGNYTVVKNQCSAGPAGKAGDSSGVVLGSGSLSWLTLLPLLGAGLARRRRH